MLRISMEVLDFSMKWGDLMVNLAIIIDCLAMLGYIVQGDWKRSFYWFACTLVMIAVRIM